MATNTTTPFRTSGRMWDKLTPAIPHPEAHEMHGKLKPSTQYLMGQVLGWDETNGYWDVETSATTGPARRVLPYPYLTDANGYAQLGTAANPPGIDEPKFESVPMYYEGAFFIADLVGVTSAAIANALGRIIQGNAYNSAGAIISIGESALTV